MERRCRADACRRWRRRRHAERRRLFDVEHVDKVEVRRREGRRESVLQELVDVRKVVGVVGRDFVDVGKVRRRLHFTENVINMTITRKLS